MPARLLNRLRSAGLAPSTRDYTRFVIVGPARSGTNLMVFSLGNHPEVLCDGELFHSSPTKSEFLRPGYSRVLRNPRTIALRDHEPEAFFQQLVFPPVAPHVRAVGFKLLYGHLKPQKWARAMEHLRQSHDLRVVLLSRRNYLEKLVSVKLARARRQWRIEESGKVRELEETPVIRFDVEHLRQRFEGFDAGRQRTRAYWAGHPLHEVVYEDLASDFAGTMKGVQDFLGISTVPLRAGTRKMTNQRPADLIVNFEELKQHFAGSKWSHLFDNEGS